MRTLVPALLLALSTMAQAEPLVLQQQLRLLDSVGSPLNGEQALTISLWTDATSTDTADRLWSGSFTPTFVDGYVSLALSADDEGVDVDSRWFREPVYLQMQVDGAVMGERQRVADVPGATGGSASSTRRYSLMGNNWTTTPGVSVAVTPTAVAGASRFDPTAGSQTLLAMALTDDGLSAGEQLSIDAELAFTCQTEDCDLGLWLTDAAGAYCGPLFLEQGGYDANQSSGTSPSIGWTATYPYLSLWLHMDVQADGSVAYFAQDRRGGRSGSTTCTNTLDASRALSLRLIANEADELFDVHFLDVVVTRDER